MSATVQHPFGSPLENSTNGSPVLVAGDVRRPIRTEAQARSDVARSRHPVVGERPLKSGNAIVGYRPGHQYEAILLGHVERRTRNIIGGCVLGFSIIDHTTGLEIAWTSRAGDVPGLAITHYRAGKPSHCVVSHEGAQLNALPTSQRLERIADTVAACQAELDAMQEGRI